MKLLDGPCIFNESMHDCVWAAFLDRPGNERDGEKVELIWPAEAKGALSLAVAGEVETRGATDNEHKSALGKSGAESPEMGCVVAEKAHEVAHLEQMNHSAAFWALVERLFPGHQAQRDWLKRHGEDLHRYQF